MIIKEVIKMAGKVCPNCHEETFFLTTGKDRKCSKCGYEMRVPPNFGKGGRGKKCANCGSYTVFANKCRTCGAEYSLPKKT